MVKEKTQKHSLCILYERVVSCREGYLVKLVSVTPKRERGLVVASDDWLRAKKE